MKYENQENATSGISAPAKSDASLANTQFYRKNPTTPIWQFLRRQLNP